MSQEFIKPDKIEEPSIQVISVKFTSLQLGLYGLILIVIDKIEHTETINGIVTTYSDVNKFELDAPFKKIQDYIYNLKTKGHFNHNLSSNLVIILQEIFANHKTEIEIRDAINNYNYKRLNAVFSSVVSKALNEKTPIVESLIKNITQNEYTSVTNKKNSHSNSNSSNTISSNIHSSNSNSSIMSINTKASSKILSVQPIIAPTKGKPIYQLKVGDKIMIRILPYSDQNRYIEMFALEQNNEILPMPAEIIDIKAGKTPKEPVEIIVRIVGDLLGYFTEEENSVRIKVFGINSNSSDALGSQQQALIPAIVSIFVIIILALFIIIQIVY